MPGSTPNVSRDVLTYSRFYDGVRLQQGVPIPDSDWNELEDYRLLFELLMSEHLVGDGGFDGGFSITGTGAANDFTIESGWANVGGAVVVTTTGNVPADITYDDPVNNVIVNNGVVTGVGGGILTDAYKNWISAHDLVATANHSACRVLMTSGAESGNEFLITAALGNDLTLFGGTGAIAPTDTYVVLPPDLTAPGGARNDCVYLHVWWEDTAGEEDTSLPIIHAGLGVETSHRRQRRWCVRVNENTVNPPAEVAGARNGFGHRYLKLAGLTRNGANIAAGQVTNVAEVLSLAAHEMDDSTATVHGIDTSTFAASGADGDDFAAGLGTPATINNLFLQIELLTARRRSFNDVYTDSAASHDGSRTGPNGVDALVSSVKGCYSMVRRGAYEFTIAGLTSADPDIHVVGEGPELVTLASSAGLAANFGIIGTFENLRLDNADPDFPYETSNGKRLTLRNVDVEKGALRVEGGVIDWRGGQTDEVSAIPAFQEDGVLFTEHDATTPPCGVIENVVFRGAPTSSPGPDSAVTIEDVAATYPAAVLTFRNCLFLDTACATAAVFVEHITNLQIVFEQCVFWAATALPAFKAHEVRSLTMRDCMFISGGAFCAGFEEVGGLLENCHFLTSLTDEGGFAQSLYFTGLYNNETPLSIRDCTAYLGTESCSVGSSVPMVEFGGIGTVPASYGSLLVDGFKVVFETGIGVNRYSSVVCHGGTWRNQVQYRNLCVDVNGNQCGVDRGVRGQHGRAAILEFEYCLAENIEVVNVDNPSIADDGAVVLLYSTEMHGLKIDGEFGGTGVATMGGAEGLIKLDQYSILTDLHMLLTTPIAVPAGGTARWITMETECVLSDVKLYRLPIGAVHNLVFVNGDRAVCDRFRSRGVLAIDAALTLVGYNVGVLEGRVRDWDLIVTSPGVPLLYAAEGSIVSGNCIKVASPQNPTFGDNGADRVLFHGNVLLSQDATAPTVTVTGTGSLEVDNLKAANAS